MLPGTPLWLQAEWGLCGALLGVLLLQALALHCSGCASHTVPRGRVHSCCAQAAHSMLRGLH